MVVAPQAAFSPPCGVFESSESLLVVDGLEMPDPPILDQFGVDIYAVHNDHAQGAAEFVRAGLFHGHGFARYASSQSKLGFTAVTLTQFRSVNSFEPNRDCLFPNQYPDCVAIGDADDLAAKFFRDLGACGNRRRGTGKSRQQQHGGDRGVGETVNSHFDQIPRRLCRSWLMAGLLPVFTSDTLLLTGCTIVFSVGFSLSFGNRLEDFLVDFEILNRLLLHTDFVLDKLVDECVPID
jgi:hypothetical protein